MPLTDHAPQSEIFNEYRCASICGELAIDGKPKYWPTLCTLAGLTPKNETFSGSKEQWQHLYEHLPEKYRDEVILIEKTMADRYAIDADCHDDQLMLQTVYNFKKILKNIPNDGGKNTVARQEILNHIYSIYEQYAPENKQIRFAVLKQKVKEIKQNDGSFDHNPLNISARRMEYFMSPIPAKERYALLLEIERKTVNHQQYDYTRLKKQLSEAYMQEKENAKYEKKMAAQYRYEQIRDDELPMADDNKSIIALYEELLNLVNHQDWGRQRKFNEKKSILNKLIPLYRAEGMFKEAEHAAKECDKFINARNICREAARIKGYGNGKSR